MAEFKRIIQRTTNSERVETGVADLQPNEICIVEDGEELIYKDKNGKFISVSKDKYKVDTIEDLKNSKKYKIGDVVEVLGYYTVGDGAGHLRQKKAEVYVGADAIIGADGSIWGIVHSGKVNISWFGDSFKFVDFSNQHGNLIIIMDKNLDITSTLYFYKEVKIKWESGTITSSVSLDTVIELGDRNIGIDETQGSVDWHTQKHYSIEGCLFKNITTDKLIKINTGVTEPIIKNNTFVNIIPKNPPSSTVLYLGKSIWYGVISDNNYSGETDVRIAKFLFNESYGNTLLRITNNLITSLNGLNEIAVDIDAGHSLLSENKIEGWQNNVRLGTNCTGIRCINNYFEMSGNMDFGTFTIEKRADSSKAILENFEISGNYSNLRNVLGSSYKSFVKFTGNIGCINGIIENNFLNNYSSIGVQRTNGYIVTDSNSQHSFNIIINNNNLLMKSEPLYTNSNIKALGNQSTTNFNLTIGDSEIVNDGYSIIQYYYDEKMFYRFFTDGRVGFGRNSIDAKYHFSEDVRAKFLRLDNISTEPSLVPQISFFMKNDNLYFKNQVFGVTQLTGTSVQLNTPYYTTKMQEEGILGEYYAYLDQLHEYEKQSNNEIMTLEIKQEPILPKVIEDFAREHNLI